MQQGAQVEKPTLRILRYEDEDSFKARLYRILSQEPYSHVVFAHDPLPGATRRFSVSGSRAYVDFYILTRPTWPWHKLFPAIGIEVKLARSMGWLIDATHQIATYWQKRREATYLVNGKTVPPPSVFLLCTDTSFHDGELYMWHAAADLESRPGRFESDSERRGGWKAITDFCDRVLMKEGASVLRQGYFYSNLWYDGKKGPVRRFNLHD